MMLQKNPPLPGHPGAAKKPSTSRSSRCNHRDSVEKWRCEQNLAESQVVKLLVIAAEWRVGRSGAHPLKRIDRHRVRAAGVISDFEVRPLDAQRLELGFNLWDVLFRKLLRPATHRFGASGLLVPSQALPSTHPVFLTHSLGMCHLSHLDTANLPLPCKS